MHSKAPISNASHSTFNTPLHTCIHPISVYIVTTAPNVTSDLLSKYPLTVRFDPTPNNLVPLHRL